MEGKTKSDSKSGRKWSSHRAASDPLSAWRPPHKLNSPNGPDGTDWEGTSFPLFLQISRNDGKCVLKKILEHVESRECSLYTRDHEQLQKWKGSFSILPGKGNHNSECIRKNGATKGRRGLGGAGQEDRRTPGRCLGQICSPGSCAQLGTIESPAELASQPPERVTKLNSNKDLEVRKQC